MNLPNQRNTQEAEMLLTEYREISNNMRSFWRIRISILGFGITLSGVLLTQLKSEQVLQIFILEFSLLIIVMSLVIVLTSLTQHLVIYGIRLSEIESHFVKLGFWYKWGIYVKKHPKYTSTKSISYVIQLLNLIIVLFMIWNNFSLISHTDNSVIIIIGTTCLILFSLWIFWFTNYRLNPGRYWDQLKAEWKSL